MEPEPDGKPAAAFSLASTDTGAASAQTAASATATGGWRSMNRVNGAHP